MAEAKYQVSENVTIVDCSKGISTANKNDSSVYDNAYRTLWADTPELLIPFINEIFGMYYSHKENIILLSDGIFAPDIKKDWRKRIVDGYVKIKTERFHVECQSTCDATMSYREPEYDLNLSLSDAKYENGKCYLTLPHSAVLFLRSNKNTPDEYKTIIRTPSGAECVHVVKVIKMSSYTLDELFAKRLYFMLPFYIFTHESHLEEYEKDDRKIKLLLDEYTLIKSRLDTACVENQINTYCKRIVFAMIATVAHKLAEKYPNIKKGIGDIMGGEIIECEAQRIWDAAQEALVKEKAAEWEALEKEKAAEWEALEKEKTAEWEALEKEKGTKHYIMMRQDGLTKFASKKYSGISDTLAADLEKRYNFG